MFFLSSLLFSDMNMVANYRIFHRFVNQILFTMYFGLLRLFFSFFTNILKMLIGDIFHHAGFGCI